MELIVRSSRVSTPHTNQVVGSPYGGPLIAVPWC
jgi:hypothetical protein